MGTTISKNLRDPFGFGNTELAKKQAKWTPIPANISGLSIAITGANSGIGLAATIALAEKGAKIYMLCRDKEQSMEIRDQIKGDITVLQLDVSDYKSILALKLPPVDVFIHNAGAMFNKPKMIDWPSGPLDETFALFLAGPYLLTKKVQSKYTIFVSSGGMYTSKLNVEKAMHPSVPYDGMDAYARCKRAQVVLARILGHQCEHPGWVNTPGVQKAMPKFYERTADILRTPEEGADTIVWLAATQPKQIGFWFDREIVTEFKFPFTTHAKEEEEKLMNELDKIVAAVELKK